MAGRQARGSEEHKCALPSHRDLHSFPTRRSSDLIAFGGLLSRQFLFLQVGGKSDVRHAAITDGGTAGQGIGRAQVCTPITPRSTLFPYTTLFRSDCVWRPAFATIPVLASRWEK